MKLSLRRQVRAHTFGVRERTGSGKTNVAAEIVRQHLLHKMDSKADVDMRATQHVDKRVAFVVPTNHLVQQQNMALKSFFPERAKCITVDSRKDVRFVRNADIIVCTAEILWYAGRRTRTHFLHSNALDAIDAIERVQVADFSLIILDECHNARGDSPYTSVFTSCRICELTLIYFACRTNDTHWSSLLRVETKQRCSGVDRVTAVVAANRRLNGVDRHRQE
jgi:superfamily II DNA or RNA helicase